MQDAKNIRESGLHVSAYGRNKSSRPVELVCDSSDDDVTNHPSISNIVSHEDIFMDSNDSQPLHQQEPCDLNKVWTWDMIDNHTIVSSDSEDEIEDISRQLELRVN